MYLVRYPDYRLDTAEGYPPLWNGDPTPPEGVEVTEQTRENGLAGIDLSDGNLNFQGSDFGGRN